MIDFHCHIDLYPDPVDVADRCVADGIFALSVTTTPSAWPKSRELLEREGRVRVALGLHPQIAHERAKEIALFHRHVGSTRYVGEIGLDGGSEYKAHRRLQADLFEQLLAACSSVGGRLMSLHSRHAASAVLDALERHPKAGRAVLHWFSGTTDDLKRADQLGCWFSIGPAMLASEKGRSLAALMPRERILTETDGPFATLDGQTLYPWHAHDALDALSRIWEIPVDEAEHQVAANFKDLIASLN